MIKALFEIIEAVFKAFGLIFSELWKLYFVKDHTPNASMGKARDILSKRQKGFVLDGKKSISIDHSLRHVMVSASSGKGKSSCILTPSAILIDDFSIVNYAPDPESARITKAVKRAQGYDVRTMSFVQPTGVFYNPFSRCNSQSEIGKTVTKLVYSTQKDSKGDTFFLDSSVSLISAVVTGLKAFPEYCNGYNVAHMIDCLQDEEKRPQIIQYFEKYADERTLTKLKAILGTSNNTLGSIISSAKVSLNIFNDETIAFITSRDNIDLSLLRSSKFCLYLHSSISDMSYYTPIISAFMYDVFSYLFKELPIEEDNKVLFLIDEAPSVSLDLDTIVSQGRKFGLGCLLIGQNLKSQFTSQYGAEKARTILSNCYTKVYMGADDLSVAKELSESFGTYTYTDKHDGNKKKKRALITPTEIMQMEDNTALIVTSGKKAVKVKQTPYYKNRKLKKLIQITQEKEEPIKVEQVPLLPLSELVPQEPENDEFDGDLSEGQLEEDTLTDDNLTFE